MTSIPQPFYGAYLRQDQIWPSTSAGEDVQISSMHPAQAINSYHRLLAGMDDRSAPINRGVYSSPLALALLEQAVGEAVLYASDVLEEMDSTAAVPFEFTLEECFDLLADLAAYDKEVVEGNVRQHPIKRAKYLQARLNRIQGGVT